jgi:hypothetical protein
MTVIAEGPKASGTAYLQAATKIRYAQGAFLKADFWKTSLTPRASRRAPAWQPAAQENRPTYAQLSLLRVGWALRFAIDREAIEYRFFLRWRPENDWP